MAGFETSTSNADKNILTHAVARESVRIALDEQQRRRLNDFVETFVRPETLQYFDGHTNYVYEGIRFSGIGRAGTLVHVRSRKQPTEGYSCEHLTAVVVGSLNSDDVITVTNTVSESRPDFDGTNRQTIWLDTDQEGETGIMLIDEFMTAELAKKELKDYEDFGTTPALRYEHGRWVYGRHDGIDEPMSDLERVHPEVMAVARALGIVALPAAQLIQPETAATGHIEEKVVA